MLTNFGKFCRKLRIDNSKLLLDMAKELEVSSAFLSKVENGKAKPPMKWGNIITRNYHLSNEESEKLQNIIYKERNRKILKIPSISKEDGDLMLAFARKLDTMTESDKEELKKKLESGLVQDESLPRKNRMK